MKKTIIYIVLLLLSYTGVGQTYRGLVKDIKNEPIAYANIIIKNSNNNSILTGIITDEFGKFEITVETNKEYYILINLIGYEDWIYKVEDNVEDNEEVDLGEIVLKESINALDEIVIVSQKKLIEKRSDHFVVNLGNKSFIKNANSWQTLKKAPLLSAKDNKGLSILGKNDVVVYINNRKSAFSGESLVNYLKNLPAESISKVEIYTSPPARFDAQGNGIINIILKKRPEEGLVGSISSIYRRSRYDAGKILLDLNFNKSKWNIYNSLWMSEGATYVSEKSKQFFPNQINKSTHNTDRLNPSNVKLGAKLGIDFTASKRHLFGLLLDVNYNKPKIENRTLSEYFSGTIIDSITKTTVDGSNRKRNYNINLNHLYTIDSIGSSLSWNLNYFNYENKQNTQNNNFINGSETPSTLSIDKFNSNVIQKIDNYNIKVDYYKVLSDFWNVSVGGQYYQTNTDNEIALSRFNGSDFVIDPNISNQFSFKEKVSSGYISAKYNPSSKWNYSLGLRIESTNQTGNQKTTGTVNTNEYTNVFPSAYTKYAPNNNHIFSLSINNRIVRPSFWELNPFRNYVTPQIYSDGNPFLNPSRTFNTEFSYVLKGKHTFLFNYSRQRDVIGQLSRVLEDNILNYYRDNYGVYESLGGTYIHNFKFLEGRFESQFTGNVNYKKLTATPVFNEAFTRNGMELDLRLYNYYYFLEDKSLEACLDFYYNKFGPITQSTLSPVFSTDFTLSKSFKNWSVSLYIQDILRSDKYKFNLEEDNNYSRENENYYDARRFVLSVRYRFGKNTVKNKRRRNTNSSIRNRVN